MLRRILLIGLSCSLFACHEGASTTSSSRALLPYDLSVESIAVLPRVAPGGSLAVTIRARNTGSSSWRRRSITLHFVGEGVWSRADLALSGDTAAGAVGTFSGTLGASTQIGLYQLSWQPQNGGTAFGAVLVARTEITCSDGVFCNGDERYVHGRCVDGPTPCDDGVACTADVCNEISKTCDHSGTSASNADCNICAAKNCNPSCRASTCGDDGCGGSCGLCGSGLVCATGSCIAATVPGTCANPLPLIQGTNPSAVVPAGYYVIGGDNTNGYTETAMPCNATSAREQIYSLVVDQTMGIDAQSFGIDTTLAIRAASCAGNVLACNDDAAPPGDYGSHVYALLPPGTYEIIVMGFDDHAFGPFTLAVRLVPGCVPQCDGKFCGDDGCGGTCGACASGEVCNASSRCVADPCVPACMGRQCGADGCGGSCGDCQDGKACDEVSGACKNVTECNHERPVCATTCASTQYCGSDCECHRARDPRPDLVVGLDRLSSDIVFDTLDISPSSCSVVERCVGGTGLRRLLRFTVEAVNQGQATLLVPPPKNRPDLFQFSPCHGHYHFSGFASYALLDLAGNVVLAGSKQAYCMEDTEQVLESPAYGCDKKYDCSNQGIQAGWADIYGNSLDCQWLDITGIPAGNYQLQVSLNPGREFEEASFDNNVSAVPVSIP